MQESKIVTDTIEHKFYHFMLLDDVSQLVKCILQILTAKRVGLVELNGDDKRNRRGLRVCQSFSESAKHQRRDGHKHFGVIVSEGLQALECTSKVGMLTFESLAVFGVMA